MRQCGATWKDYCNRTSLHGYAYLVNEESIWSKVYWAVIVLAGFITAMACFVSNTVIFWNATTITYINTTTASLSQIIFPSVFICNINQVTLTSLTKMGLRQSTPYKLDLELVDQIYKTYVRGDTDYYTHDTWENVSANWDFENLQSYMQNIGWNDTTPFIKVASQPLDDAILRYTWKLLPPYTFFKAYMSLTDYGPCAVLYPYLDFENPKTKDLKNRQYAGPFLGEFQRGVRNGIKNGMEVVLDAEIFDYGYFYRQSSGFMVAFADSRDKAIVNQKGFFVQPGTVNLIPLIAERTETDEAVLSRFAPQDRQCYESSEEFPFKFLKKDEGYRYSIDNCFYDSLVHRIKHSCDCLPFFASSFGDGSIDRCSGKGLSCARYFVLNIGNDEIGLHKTINEETNGNETCHQRCSFQTEVTMPTASHYPQRNTFEGRDEVCLVIKKIQKICNNDVKYGVFEVFYQSYPEFRSNLCQLVNSDLDQGICSDDHTTRDPDKQINDALYKFCLVYSKENLTKMKIFFKDPFYTEYIKNEEMSRISFLGNVGGLMGLLTGFSVVSLAEFLYFCFKAFTNK